MTDDTAPRRPALRPRDAATLLILDRAGGKVRVLMGRRRAVEVFMPGQYVFPGGRVDRGDGRAAIAAALHPAVEAGLLYKLRPRPNPSRARAIALAAIRETAEEAAIFLGRPAGKALLPSPPGWQIFADHGVVPDLSALRLVGRAITPPGQVRRYDTRFLAVWADAVAEVGNGSHRPSGELEDLRWVDLAETGDMPLPGITRRLLSELGDRLREDPGLAPDWPVPFYYRRREQICRELIACGPAAGP